jgi:hypothetical protein
MRDRLHLGPGFNNPGLDIVTYARARRRRVWFLRPRRLQPNVQT